jgi:hypothetical protein
MPCLIGEFGPLFPGFAGAANLYQKPVSVSRRQISLSGSFRGSIVGSAVETLAIIAITKAEPNIIMEYSSAEI